MELLDYIKYYDDRIDMLNYRNAELKKDMERHKILLDACLSAIWDENAGGFEYEYFLEGDEVKQALEAIFPQELENRKRALAKQRVEHFKVDKETAKKYGYIKSDDGEEDG